MIRSAIQLTPIQKLLQQKPKLYDSITVDLTNALVDKKFGIQGDFFYIFAAPSSMNLLVRFNETDQAQLPVGKGDSFNVPFHQFFLSCSAQPGQSVTILIGLDLGFEMKQLNVQNIYQIQQPVKEQAANNANFDGSPVTVDNTVGGKLVVPANAARQQVTLVNNEPNANPVRAGLAGVVYAGGAGAAGGVLIPVGGSWTFKHTLAVYAITSGAGITSNIGFEEEYNS